MIDTMPDCSMEKRLNLIQIDSFHSFLREYIELKKRDIQRFCSGDGCVYSYECHEIVREDSMLLRAGVEYDGWSNQSELFFSRYDACVDYCRRKELTDPDIDKIRIFKYPLDHTAGQGRPYKESLLLNSELKVMAIDVRHEDEHDIDIEIAFEGMCFDYPTPFQRGDIVVNYQAHEKPWEEPFVLSYITTWDSKEMLRKGFQAHECPDRRGWERFDKRTERLLKTGDYSDIGSVGTGVTEEGQLCTNGMLDNSLDLEYYRGPLKGFDRQLQLYSSYEKGEISGELLTNCCYVIRAEEYAKNIYKRCTSFYLKESMEQLGMLPPEKSQD